MNILVIEDEWPLQETIRESLEKENFHVETANTFDEAINKVSFFDYDCILLDIMLPKGSGLDILRHLRSIEKGNNVIIISAKDSLNDKLTGLDLGADDYLTKPFHLAELNARVKSLLRRRSFGRKNTLAFQNIHVDMDNFYAAVDAIPLALNRKEFDILVYFMLNKNRIVSKPSIAEKVWGDYMEDADDFDFIYSQIKNLRKKLRDGGAKVKIQPIYGMGYRLEAL
ncbi:DNA-binding response regulator, OmpR family, contains REC and winged-helix (wHTH) domain [Parapedobacter luteus]|uniref:DNA-binding response regulator, OmpR family, contains REC and winged-helix (WHTH) domain n=1 Tax=Parapedobacter luteus TaxID=623280 RepID=A0A1T5FLB3_9SPHI|nr:response regulator transcription factor [Parapedobacter luteus]SKB96872.1 DNA-binding response regulator, OmpR family, contains REC and winged-helix (wHTH) domain [Parapedobacter luteus]